MKKIWFYKICFIFLTCLGIFSCSKDNEEIIPEVKFNSVVGGNSEPYYKVSGLGGEINISFTTNTSWYLAVDSYGGIAFDISQDAGNKGANNIVVKVWENSSKDSKKIASLSLYSENNTYLGKITIEQNPYPQMQLSNNEVTINQLNGQASIYVTSNVDYEIVIPDEYKNWISTARNDSQIDIICTDNEELSDRKGKVLIKSEDLTKEIEVTQKGGVFIVTQVEPIGSMDDAVDIFTTYGDGIVYSLPPTSSEYELKIRANIDFELSMEKNAWLLELNLKEKKNNQYTYSFKTLANNSEENSSRDALIVIKYSNGDKYKIEMSQRDWGVTVYVNNGESLSQKLDEIKDGYKLKTLHINGGILDCNYTNQSLNTVKKIAIENVETIPDYFCYSISSLEIITLTNVKKIGTAAFDGCTSLATIYLPSTLEYIGNYAFYQTNNNRTVYAKMQRPCSLGGKNSWERGEWYGTLYVPLGSLNSYKGNDDWRMAFASIKESSNM